MATPHPQMAKNNANKKMEASKKKNKPAKQRYESLTVVCINLIYGKYKGVWHAATQSL